MAAAYAATDPTAARREAAGAGRPPPVPSTVLHPASDGARAGLPGGGPGWLSLRGIGFMSRRGSPAWVIRVLPTVTCLLRTRFSFSDRAAGHNSSPGRRWPALAAGGPVSSPTAGLDTRAEHPFPDAVDRSPEDRAWRA